MRTAHNRPRRPKPNTLHAYDPTPFHQALALNPTLKLSRSAVARWNAVLHARACTTPANLSRNHPDYGLPVGMHLTNKTQRAAGVVNV